MNMPSWIREALEESLEGVSRKELAARAESLSAAYRAQGGSTLIRTQLDALAYALVRMPATYAAVRYALQEAAQRCAQLQPASLLDVGAGPGTASWAAADVWPSLGQMTLLDQNAALLEVSRKIGKACGDARVEHVQGTIPAALGEAADLVVASYALTEIPASALNGVLEKLWPLAQQMLVIVEPGTPEGFRRILQYREWLKKAGAHVVAPCTHMEACPLHSAERWCHFSQRLSRTRDHLQVKSASVNYEDEKLCYLVAVRQEPAASAKQRILSTPRVNKGEILLQTCAPGAVELVTIRRAQKQAYKAARHYSWGDAV